VGGTIGFIETWLGAARRGRAEHGTHGDDKSRRTPGAETAELLRRSGAEVRVDGSEEAVLWEKLARQAPVAAATALTQRPIGELRSDPSCAGDWRMPLSRPPVALADGVDSRPRRSGRSSTRCRPDDLVHCT